MQIIKLIVLIIFCNIMAGFALDYKFQTLTSDFKDITHYENQVIVYGDDNLIKYSSDFGNTWENKYLVGVTKINFIKYQSSSIDFIVDDSLYFNSENINSIPTKKIAIRKGIIWNIKASNEYFVVVYDSIMDIYKKNDFSLQTISFDKKNNQTALLLNDKSIFISRDQENLKEYDLKTFELIKEYSDSCKNCRDITDIKVIHNQYIVSKQSKSHENASYYFSIDTLNKEQIEIGTYLKGYVFDVKQKILGPELQIVADSIRYHKYLQHSGQSEIDELFFSTYHLYDKEMKQIAVNINNYYNEIITSATKLSNGNIIVVGNNNAIFLSKDNGITWENKMSLTNDGNSRLEKIGNKLILNNTWNAIITESLDNGITWKNQKRYEEDFRAKPLTSIIDSINGKLTYLFIDSVFKKSTDKDLDYTFAKKDIKFTDLKNLESRNINESTDKFNVFSFNKRFQLSKNAVILFFDKENNLVKNVRLDSMAILKMFITDTSNFKLLVGERKQSTIDTANGYIVIYGNSKTKLIETKNGGLSWNVLDVLDSTLDNAYREIKSINDNSDLMLASYFQIDLKNASKSLQRFYILNINDDKIKIVYYDSFNETKKGSLYFINQFKNNYILSCQNYFLKLDENFKVIDTITTPKGRDYFQAVNLEDKLLLLSSGKRLNYFQENPTNSIESEITEDRPSYLYIYNPYPMPARNYVKTQIAWDIRFDIQKADIEVYDVNGCLVQTNGKYLEIKPTEQYAGSLIWNITDEIQSGFYLIKINYFGTQKIIPIVVSK